jgi:superfamily II DNA/RNA helicase
LPVVVNYELPTVAQDYIHRIGRTGRAGQSGEAISLVCAEEVDLLRAIQRLLRRAIPWRVEDGFVPPRPAEDVHHIRVRDDGHGIAVRSSRPARTAGRRGVVSEGPPAARSRLRD